MEFHVLYEIECPRPWGGPSRYDRFWEALGQPKAAELPAPSVSLHRPSQECDPWWKAGF